MDSKPLVIYHYPCLDGFTAAYAVWKVHPDWEFYPAKHGDPPPEVTGRNVYFVDFSYKRPVIEDMLTKANKITILDHHQTAMDDLKNLANIYSIDKLEVHFDMNKSGARLAWEYFQPGKKCLNWYNMSKTGTYGVSRSLKQKRSMLLFFHFLMILKCGII